MTKKRAPTTRPKRKDLAVCDVCGKILSMYNTKNRCFSHQPSNFIRNYPNANPKEYALEE